MSLSVLVACFLAGASGTIFQAPHRSASSPELISARAATNEFFRHIGDSPDERAQLFEDARSAWEEVQRSDADDAELATSALRQLANVEALTADSVVLPRHEPRLVFAPTPMLPEGSVGGNVDVSILVDPSGAVRDVGLLRPRDDEDFRPNALAFSALASAALRQYEPYLVAGVPTAWRGVVNVDFAKPFVVADGVVDVLALGLSPTPIVRPAPAYPAIARAANLNGDVVLDIVVDKKGVVTSVTVARSQPPFDQPAKASVLRWRFRPLVVNGAPVAWTRRVTVTFRLR